MYYFEAVYYNIDTDTEETVKIQFDGQFFHSEKECYKYAMERALDKMTDGTVLLSVNFIAC